MGRALVMAVLAVASLVRADIADGGNGTTTTRDARRDQLDDLLANITDVTSGNLGSLCISQQYSSVPVHVRTEPFEPARQKADLVARLVKDLGQIDNQELLKLVIKTLMKSDAGIEASRIVTYSRASSSASSASGANPTTERSAPNAAADAAKISAVFAASALRPASPYAEPDVRVDYVQKAPDLKVNNSVIQQVTKSPGGVDGSWIEAPWFPETWARSSLSSSSSGSRSRNSKFMANTSNSTYLGWWTYPYYSCSARRWLLTYAIAIAPGTSGSSSSRGIQSVVPADRLDGVLSVDVSVSGFDVNQCPGTADGPSSSSIESTFGRHVVSFFTGTHKCHESSTCRFQRGHGWSRGGYTCTCLPGYYSPVLNGSSFNGSHVEQAYRDKMAYGSEVYDRLYRCLPCAAGCDQCIDDSPCLAPYDWPFRIVLLVISMIWAAVSIGMMGFVYKYRRLRVFKVASPTFLCVTLLGCAIMYAEMAAIFPELNTPACVATKWTRHMGFTVTYSSLLMKTWRVSLTYRVKSAHKLKLTDRQLLQWMVPIILVATVYLGAWTASDPPTGEYILTGPTMRFTQCTYNWWDHSLAIGEVFFLVWGIHVCYSVRRAETYYNETKHISWAVYNIALTNTVFASFHLLLLPNVGPDMKYLFGFIRTQMSTTVTIALVFGPKFYLVAMGRGDEYDSRTKARTAAGVSASFSLNGMNAAGCSAPGSTPGSYGTGPGGIHSSHAAAAAAAAASENLENSGNMPEPDNEPVDLYRENEELKEQLQKLAGHMEFMKIVHMGVNNPHLKPKPGGYFTHGGGHHTPPTIATGHIGSIPAASDTCLLRRTQLEPMCSSAVVHFDSDVLLSRKNSSHNNPRAVGQQLQQTVAPPPPPPLPLPQPVIKSSGAKASSSSAPSSPGTRGPACLSAAVDDAVLDDSPTAELLPNSGQKL